MQRIQKADPIESRETSTGVLHARRLYRPRVAILDGLQSRRDALMASLAGFYQLADYPDSIRAYAGMRMAMPEVIVVDENLPPHDGFDFVARLRRDPAFPRIPVILIASDDQLATRRAMAECGADTLLSKPFRRTALIQAISTQINRAVESDWDNLPGAQREALRGTVEAFRGLSDTIDRGEPITFGPIRAACHPLVQAVNTSDVRSLLAGVRRHDDYSYAHSLRVATFLTLFGYALGLTAEEQNLLAGGGLLHDVGKIAIPLTVLNKPGRLDAREYEVMKNHVTASAEYLRTGPHHIPQGVLIIAEQHHEKLDGSGYPYGLRASQLNELARMASIVDVFVALTDRRVYKPSLEAEKALHIMTHDMGGRHLDLHLLRLFRETLLDAAAEVTGTML